MKCNILKKTTVEQHKILSVYRLKKEKILCEDGIGSLVWKNHVHGDMSINYHIVTDENGKILTVEYIKSSIKNHSQKEYKYNIFIVPTECRFGGCRWWFLCPNKKDDCICNKKVAKLYFDMDGRFACRHCLNLSYAKRNQTWSEKYSLINKFLESDKKISLLKTRIHKRTYKGRPTKLQKKLKQEEIKYVKYRELILFKKFTSN